MSFSYRQCLNCHTMHMTEAEKAFDRCTSCGGSVADIGGIEWMSRDECEATARAFENGEHEWKSEPLLQGDGFTAEDLLQTVGLCFSYHGKRFQIEPLSLAPGSQIKGPHTTFRYEGINHTVTVPVLYFLMLHSNVRREKKVYGPRKLSVIGTSHAVLDVDLAAADALTVLGLELFITIRSDSLTEWVTPDGAPLAITTRLRRGFDSSGNPIRSWQIFAEDSPGAVDACSRSAPTFSQACTELRSSFRMSAKTLQNLDLT